MFKLIRPTALVHYYLCHVSWIIFYCTSKLRIKLGTFGVVIVLHIRLRSSQNLKATMYGCARALSINDSFFVTTDTPVFVDRHLEVTVA
jgi:hypothetical protein